MSRLVNIQLARQRAIAEKLAWQEHVLHDGELSTTARLIACQLTHDMRTTRRRAWRSQESIAEVLRINVRTVRRGVAELVARGHLDTRPSAGRGNSVTYTANLTEEITARIDAVEARKRRTRTTSPPSEKADISETTAVKDPEPQAAAAGNVRPYLEGSSPPVNGGKEKSPRSSAEGQQELAFGGERQRVGGELTNQVKDERGLVDVPWTLSLAIEGEWGRAFVTSYVDRSRFHIPTNTLVAWSSRAHIELRQRVDWFRSRGIKVADGKCWNGASHGQEI